MTRKMYKVVERNPPEDLMEAIKNIINFPTYRHAKEFFETGKKSLEEELLWPKSFFIRGKSGLFYEKKDSFLELRYENNFHVLDSINVSMGPIIRQINKTTADHKEYISVWRNIFQGTTNLEKKRGKYSIDESIYATLHDPFYPGELLNAVRNDLKLDFASIGISKDGKYESYDI